MQINLHPNAEQALRKLMEQQGFSSPESAINALILNVDSESSSSYQHSPRLPDPPIIEAIDSLYMELPRIPPMRRLLVYKLRSSMKYNGLSTLES